MTHSETTGTRQDRIVFFDTTLRDGEQSPGCSMCTPEKIEMAHALDDLGVDILEAGFAISSEGDFQAIRAHLVQQTRHETTRRAFSPKCGIRLHVGQNEHVFPLLIVGEGEFPVFDQFETAAGAVVGQRIHRSPT